MTSAAVKKRKPAPDVLMACARELDVNVNKCLAIGDSVSDILAAKRAGAIPVAVATGLENSDKLKEEKPEALLEKLDELVGLLVSRPGMENLCRSMVSK